MASQGLCEPLTCHPVIDTHTPTSIGSSPYVGACQKQATRFVSGTTDQMDQDYSIGPDTSVRMPQRSDQPAHHRCNQRPQHLPRRRVGLNGNDFLKERSRNSGDTAHLGEDGSANELDLLIASAELVGSYPQQPDGASLAVCWDEQI